MKIIGVNGIWNPDKGKRSFTDKMLFPLKIKGYRVRDIEYKTLFSFKAYFNDELEKRALLIIDAYEPGDAVVAHSAGCLLTAVAMRLGARFSKVFFYRAAAERDIEFPEGAFTKLYNIYSPDDRALLVGGCLPRHPFGWLGRYGYTGSNPNVVNIESFGDHNDDAEPENIEKWVRFMDKELRPPRKKIKRAA